MSPGLTRAQDVGRSQHRTPERPDRRIQTHRFLQNLKRKGQGRQIGKARRSPAEHGLQLGVESLPDLGVAREQVPRPGQRVGRGLVSGEEDRHHLVAKLFIVHALAGFLVLGVEQLNAGSARNPRATFPGGCALAQIDLTSLAPPA
jgi:hypothetical protein